MSKRVLHFTVLRKTVFTDETRQTLKNKKMFTITFFFLNVSNLFKIIIQF